MASIRIIAGAIISLTKARASLYSFSVRRSSSHSSFVIFLSGSSMRDAWSDVEDVEVGERRDGSPHWVGTSEATGISEIGKRTGVIRDGSARDTICTSQAESTKSIRGDSSHSTSQV